MPVTIERYSHETIPQASRRLAWALVLEHAQHDQKTHGRRGQATIDKPYKKEGYDSTAATIKGGGEIELRDHGVGTYTARVAGKVIATADLDTRETKDFLTNVRVEKEHRRKGVASALYDYIESRIGQKLRASPHRVTDAGKALRKSRESTVVEHLPGGHDQAKHGRRGQAAPDKGGEFGGQSVRDEINKRIDDDIEKITSDSGDLETFIENGGTADELEAVYDAWLNTGLHGDAMVAGIQFDEAEFDPNDYRSDLYKAVERQESLGLGLDGLALSPGQETLDGGNYEPKEEPSLDEFMRNQYPTSRHVSAATGFVLHDGKSVDMDHGQGERADDHRSIIPTEAAMKRWGWDKRTHDNRSEALFETMKRARAIRVHVGRDDLLVDTVHNPTSSQKRAIAQFASDTGVNDFRYDVANGTGGRTISGQASGINQLFNAIDTAFEELTGSSDDIRESAGAAEVIEHLPGGHDQLKHGRRGGGGDVVTRNGLKAQKYANRQLGVAKTKDVETMMSISESQFKVQLLRTQKPEGYKEQIKVLQKKDKELWDSLPSHQHDDWSKAIASYQAHVLAEDIAGNYQPGFEFSDQSDAEILAQQFLPPAGVEKAIFNTTLSNAIVEKQFKGNVTPEKLSEYTDSELDILAVTVDKPEAKSVLRAAYQDRKTAAKQKLIDAARLENTNSDSSKFANDSRLIRDSENGNLGYMQAVHERAPGATIETDSGVKARRDVRASLKKTIARDVGENIGIKLDATFGRNQSEAALIDAAKNMSPESREAFNVIKNRGAFRSDYEAAGEAVAASINDSWAKSSTNGNATSVALQKAVAKKFGLDMEVGAVSRDGDRLADELLKDHGPVFDAAVDSIYQNTQEHLEKHGIDELVVYRGMNLTDVKTRRVDDEYEAALDILKTRADLPSNAVFQDGWVTDAKITGNPISSYSAHYKTAEAFGSGGDYSMMIASHVKRKDIFSTSVTGPGCLTENEVCVIRHNQDAKVLTVKDAPLPDRSDNNPESFWDTVETSKDI